MSEPTELSPNHKPTEPQRRRKFGAGKGSRKTLYGLLTVSLAGAVVWTSSAAISGPIRRSPTP